MDDALRFVDHGSLAVTTTYVRHKWLQFLLHQAWHPELGHDGHCGG
jgi:hypothetical protein